MITQVKALTRMEVETRKEMRALEDAYNAQLGKMWAQTVAIIGEKVAATYRRDFGRGTWDIVGAQSKGTLHSMGSEARAALDLFKANATYLIKNAITHIKTEEKVRALWMIDQVTPDSVNPKSPAFGAREAAGPRDYQTAWEQVVSTWIETYHSQLLTNLKMEALHEGDIHDAAEEPSATHIDNYDPAYKLNSLFATEAVKAQADARREVFDENDDLIETEIWVTMEDGAVCPICEDYDGKPMEDVPDDIPAHHNCRCYSRFVPKAFAEMLRSGDPAEKEMALQMDDAGIVPDSMPIYSQKTGDLIGRAVVSFEDWKGSRGQNIAGIARIK
jgi:hypothetical protein